MITRIIAKLLYPIYMEIQKLYWKDANMSVSYSSLSETKKTTTDKEGPLRTSGNLR